MKRAVQLVVALGLAACEPRGALEPVARSSAEPAPRPAQPAVTPAAPAPPVSVGDLEASAMRVYEEAGRGVVNITSRSVSYDFFMNPVPQEGSGSGFVWDDRGHIVTNHHVIEAGEELQVTLADGAVLSARAVGTDPSNDLAVLRVESGAGRLHPIPLGDSRGLKVGRFVVAIGNPFGLGGTMTLGVVSSLGRVIQSQDNRYIGEIIQTDASINPGNSGGPLLDLTGRVVGVNSAIISPSGASAGIGFAIPATTVARVIPELIARGRYPHPWLGVNTYDVTPALAEVLERSDVRAPREGGLLVLDVVEGSPAEQAGIRGADRALRFGRTRFPVGGDFVTSVAGEKVDSLQTLTVALETRTRVGETVAVGVLRAGRAMTLRVTLRERPERRRY